MRPFYAISAVIGTIVPWAFFGSYLTEVGPDPLAFLAALFANGAAGGFSADVLISLIVFWVWSWRDAQALDLANWWLVIPSGCLVGLSLALPLYLWLREGRGQTVPQT